MFLDFHRRFLRRLESDPPNPNTYSPAFLQKWDTTGTSPKISVSPTYLTMADTAVGSVSPSQTVTIGNTGAGPMELAIVLAAAVGNLNNPGDFVTTNNCPASLAPNSSCTINVSFAPGAPNPACQGVIACTDSRSASLDIVSNAIGGLQVVSLAGNTGGGASLSVQPNPIVFPAQAAGTASQNLGVLVSNNGDIALSITNASITGPNAADFKAVLTSTGGPGCNLPVPTGGSYCQMEVQFTPAAGATGNANRESRVDRHRNRIAPNNPAQRACCRFDSEYITYLALLRDCGHGWKLDRQLRDFKSRHDFAAGQ